MMMLACLLAWMFLLLWGTKQKALRIRVCSHASIVVAPLLTSYYPRHPLNASIDRFHPPTAGGRCEERRGEGKKAARKAAAAASTQHAARSKQGNMSLIGLKLYISNLSTQVRRACLSSGIDRPLWVGSCVRCGGEDMCDDTPG